MELTKQMEVSCSSKDLSSDRFAFVINLETRSNKLFDNNWDMKNSMSLTSKTIKIFCQRDTAKYSEAGECP